MSAETLCQFGESTVADHQCARCGALVCATHPDRETGWCIDCATALDP